MSTGANVAWSRSKWLSKSDAALYIHKDPRQLQKLLDSGEIPASAASGARRGRNQTPVVYIHIDDLDAYMRSVPYEGSNSASPILATQKKPNGPRTQREIHSDGSMTYERGQQINRTVMKAGERARRRKALKKGDAA